MSYGDSGFARALATLSESEVDFVIVGVGGINFIGGVLPEGLRAFDDAIAEMNQHLRSGRWD